MSLCAEVAAGCRGGDSGKTPSGKSANETRNKPAVTFALNPAGSSVCCSSHR